MYVLPEPEENFDKYDEMRLHMKQLLSTHLIELDVPMRIAIPLDDAGIRRLRDVVVLTREDLLKIDRIGLKAADEIERVVERSGLSLGMKLEEGWV